MQKIRKILSSFMVFLVAFLVSAIPANAENSEVLNKQKTSLNISGFVEEAQKYTSENFEELNIDEMLNSAIKGEIDNSSFFSGIGKLLGTEVKQAITVLGSILVIIVIHSILKSISENLENKAVSQITYYVQYVLIVTLILSNFSNIIEVTKDSIESLVGFMNCLIPVLMTLMLATRKYYICCCHRTCYPIFN